MEVLCTHVHAVRECGHYCNGLSAVYTHMRGHLGHIWGPRTHAGALIVRGMSSLLLPLHAERRPGTGVNLAQSHNSHFCRQMELRKVSQEKEKAQTENDKLMYDLERVATQNNKSQSALEKSQEEVARLQVSSKSTGQRPWQGPDNGTTPGLRLQE